METLLVVVLILLVPAAFVAGRYVSAGKIRNQVRPRRIEEYPFYPFITNDQGIVEFSLPMFNQAVNHLNENKNPFAAQQLIIIGEQNRVRDLLGSSDLNAYLSL
mgnify:CR=1 FL=1